MSQYETDTLVEKDEQFARDMKGLMHRQAQRKISADEFRVLAGKARRRAIHRHRMQQCREALASVKAMGWCPLRGFPRKDGSYRTDMGRYA